MVESKALVYLVDYRIFCLDEVVKTTRRVQNFMKEIY